jgi:hypothetical protein
MYQCAVSLWRHQPDSLPRSFRVYVEMVAIVAIDRDFQQLEFVYAGEAPAEGLIQVVDCLLELPGISRAGAG